MNVFENRINRFLDDFIKESFDSGFIKYDYNLLTFDNNQIFIVNESILMEQNKLAVLYSELINEYMLNYNIDFVLSFSDTKSLFYNSGLSFRKNVNVFFVDSKAIVKKSIYGLNTLISKYGVTETNNGFSFIIPMIFKFDNKNCKKLISLINLLKKLVKINRIFILSIFDLNNTKSESEDLLQKFRNNDISVNIINKSLIDINSIYERLEELNIIDANLLKKINMFTKHSNIDYESNGLKVIQNKLFLHFKNLCQQKKTKLCLSLECIEESTEVIKYTNLLGSYIVAIKINSNFIYNESVLKGLKKLAEHHNFIIIDDKKLIVKNMTELKKINLFKYVDVVSINLRFISNEIESWFLQQRSQVNPNASFIIQIDEEGDRDLVEKMYNYFNNYVFGVVGLNKTDKDMFTLVNYKDVSHLNDNFKSLKNSDLVIIEDELYKSKNPLDIVTKINTITSS